MQDDKRRSTTILYCTRRWTGLCSSPPGAQRQKTADGRWQTRSRPKPDKDEIPRWSDQNGPGQTMPCQHQPGEPSHTVIAMLGVGQDQGKVKVKARSLRGMAAKPGLLPCTSLIQSGQARHLKQASSRCRVQIHSLSQRRRGTRGAGGAGGADGWELELELELQTSSRCIHTP